MPIQSSTLFDALTIVRSTASSRSYAVAARRKRQRLIRRLSSSKQVVVRIGRYTWSELFFPFGTFLKYEYSCTVPEFKEK